MESSIEYQNLMNSAISDATRETTSQKEDFEEKLQETQEKKGLIMDLTNLAVMPFEAKVSAEGLKALAKGVDKISGGKVSEFNDYINSKLTRVKTNAEKQLGKLKEKVKPEEKTSEDKTPENDEQEPQEAETSEPVETSEGIELQDATTFGEIEHIPTQDELMATMEQRRLEQPEITQEQIPEGAGEIVEYGNSNADMANGQASDITTQQVQQSTQDAVESASSDAVDTSADAVGASVGATTAETAGETAGAVAGDVATEAVGGALMDNPFTFFAGLAMMIGGVVGGVEGSRHVKQPSVPKPVAVPNVSTQFGM